MIVTFSMLAIVLAASACVTCCVMRRIDKIGDWPDIKSAAISKALFNFYAIAVLCVVVVIRYLRFIETDGFALLLTAVLSGLGVKFTRELKSEHKLPPALPPRATPVPLPDTDRPTLRRLLCPASRRRHQIRRADLASFPSFRGVASALR